MSTAGEAAAGAFKVNSLSGLDRVSAVEGEVVWDGPRSVWNMGMEDFNLSHADCVVTSVLLAQNGTKS